MKQEIICPKCGTPVDKYITPSPTADVIIYDKEKGIVLIERGAEPFGFALPGGFVEYGESVEDTAIREMKEETNLDIKLIGLLGVYSKPERDPRKHTISTTYVATPKNPEELKAGDDARKAYWYKLDELPSPLCFDHAKMIDDFLRYVNNQASLATIQE